MLEAAEKHPLTEERLAGQFGRLGGTVFTLDGLDVQLEEGLILPVRELNNIRRRAVHLLEAERRAKPVYEKRKIDVYEDAYSGSVNPARVKPAGKKELIALCRNPEQVRASLDHGADWIYADFEFIKQFSTAVEMVREAGKRIALATPRIHMPGETGFFRHILKLRPDAVLVRNTGALYFFMRHRRENPADHPVELIGDFSLNVANHETVCLFLEAGLSKITPSYDLNIQQMVDLLRRIDPSKAEVVIHQHLPMFHTEHCVYCTFLSEGTDYTNCGRPCERHRVSLRDRIGMLHPVRVDEGCRNTVYNAIDQSGAEYLSHFLDLGVSSFRVEFLEEPPERVREVLELYKRALRGEISGSYVWRTLKAINQLGVTRGQLVK